MNKYCAVVCDDAVEDDYCKSQSILRTDGNIKISYCIVKKQAHFALRACLLLSGLFLRAFYLFFLRTLFCGKDESCKVFLCSQGLIFPLVALHTKAESK